MTAGALIEIMKLENLLFILKRNEYGTDIYVWGFNDLDDLKFWDIKLAMGLMYAFFKAVREKKLNLKYLMKINYFINLTMKI